MSKNMSFLSGRKGLDKGIFESLGDLAADKGTPSEEGVKALAKDSLVGSAKLLGAASFYDFLNKDNAKKKVYVCNGSSCLTAGTQPRLHKKLAEKFSQEEIGHMCCMGRCHENGAFHYQGKNYSAKSAEDIEKVLSGASVESDDTYHVGGSGPLTAELGDPAEFYSCIAEKLKQGVDAVFAEIKTSAVRGRGGAGFPASFKMQAVREATADEKYIVCNADEGDPGAYIDRYLMEKKPELVLAGMLAAGFVTGAKMGVLYIRAEYPESTTRVAAAIEEMRSLGYLGQNIQGLGFDFDFKIVKGAGSYICGEETALLSSIEGQRPEVRIRPPYPAQEGLFNKPTLVNNVETLACLAFIVKSGGEAFVELGTKSSTGTKLLSLDNHFNKSGLYEVPMGTSLKDVIENMAGGFKSSIKALHIGGPLGGLVPVSKISDLTIDFESFDKNGYLLGHGSIVCVPKEFPMVKYLEHLFKFTADESCGKCFPCRLGSTRGEELLAGAQAGRVIDRELFDDLLETLEVGSLCGLGGGLPLPIKNALEHFADELKPFFAGRA